MAACPAATTARVGAHRALCLRRSEKSSKILAGSASLLPSLPFPSRPVRDMKMRASELQQAPGPAAASASVAAVPTHKVTVHDRQRGVVHEFVVPQDQYILHTAEAQDIRLPFACRHGCCTSCAVRIKSGQIRQPEALGISAELKDKGYALLCVGFPSSDVEAETQDEDEVYWLQFGRYFARGPVERDDYALELAMGDEAWLRAIATDTIVASKQGIAGKMEQPEDLAQLLPDDVLGRLPPRAVCRAWRATVGTRRMLRADLLPLSMSGILVDMSGSVSSPSRRRPVRSVRGMLKDSLFDEWARAEIMDHRNPLAQRLRA